MPEAPLRILVVCTANMCRSPLSEHLIREWVSGQRLEGQVVVESAGSDADAGAPMCGQAAEYAAIPAPSHVARRLSADQLDRADLVLAMDRSHRGACARLVPACRPRLFTLRQAADLAQRVMAVVADGRLPEGAPALPAQPAERLRWLVAELDAARGLLAGRAEGREDIEDRHGADDHRDTFVEVQAATVALTSAMAACVAHRR